MKKNGFVFIETIITVVVLSASLLLLYNSYSSSFENERDRLYYDDVAYIYRTNYVRKFLFNYSNLLSIKDYAFGDSYIITIGPDFDTMFDDNTMREALNNIYRIYKINQMVLMKKEYIENCFNENDVCKKSTENLSKGITNYIKSLSDTDYDYYLVVEYAEKNDSGSVGKCELGVDTKCSTNYVNLGV